jgi:hypothetical protein
MGKLWQRTLNASLWIVGFGLMIASSGLDGAFIVKLMPLGWGWLGLVLNTTTDIASEVISYWCGRLAQDASIKKRKMAKWLWVAQFALVFFAWLFGWRQIIPILREIEPQDWKWLAPLMAAFTPIALVAVGYTQALLAGKIENEKPAQTETKAVQVKPKVAQLKPSKIADWRGICVGLNGERRNMTYTRVNEILNEHGFEAKPESTARYWAKVAQGMDQNE